MDFQKQLLDVGNALCKEEVKALAFLCTDLLHRGLTSVGTAGELFCRLADQGLLSAEKPQLLTELLLIIQRTKMVRDLRLPEQASPLISPYRMLLYNLSEEITDNDLKDIKFLLNGRLKRRKLEENVTTLEVFLEMEKVDLMNSTDLNLLQDIIQKICPVLIEKINRFKQQQVSHTSHAAQETGRQRSVSYPQPLDAGRSLSCGIPESSLTSLTECTMSSSNTSVDFPAVFHGGGDNLEALSHQLSVLGTGSVRCDAMAMSPSTQNGTSSENLTTRTSSSNSEDLETYPMTAAKMGVCLIVNNYHFQTLKNREGTMADEECLQKVFEWLGFAVEVKSDCTMEEMRSVFGELGSRDHRGMNCVVCCVLSHGEEGGVFGVDGRSVDIKDLKAPLNGLNCPSLAEKPKLFFIQACQGEKEQKAVYIETDGPACGTVCTDAVKSNESIPSDADFLLGMATVPSFVSFRDRKNGTWFIQSLCQNLVEMVPRCCDLVSILTKVNADVSQKTDPYGEKKQMPQPSFSLRKRVVFPKPKASPPSLSH